MQKRQRVRSVPAVARRYRSTTGFYRGDRTPAQEDERKEAAQRKRALIRGKRMGQRL